MAPLPDDQEMEDAAEGFHPPAIVAAILYAWLAIGGTLAALTVGAAALRGWRG